MELDDPTGYGRVVRDKHGNVEKVVETKAEGDATPEQLAIREVNTGVYAFDGGALKAALEQIDTDNAQGELYLPDVLPKLIEAGKTVHGHVVTDPTLTLGVNDRVELAKVRKLAQQRIHDEHQRNGVTIVDPDSTIIEAGVTIGRDTIVEPSTFIRGNTTIGADCAIGPLTTLIDATLGDGVSVPHSYLVQARVDDFGTIGPFAYLRPDAHLHPKAKAGAFVEIKNSTIGDGLEGPAPVLHRRRRRGREHEHRRGQHHRQLRRQEQAPHDDRLQRPDERRHRVRGAGRSRRWGLHRSG